MIIDPHRWPRDRQGSWQWRGQYREKPLLLRAVLPVKSSLMLVVTPLVVGTGLGSDMRKYIGFGNAAQDDIAILCGDHRIHGDGAGDLRLHG